MPVSKKWRLAVAVPAAFGLSIMGAGASHGAILAEPVLADCTSAPVTTNEAGEMSFTITCTIPRASVPAPGATSTPEPTVGVAPGPASQAPLGSTPMAGVDLQTPLTTTPMPGVDVGPVTDAPQGLPIKVQAIYHMMWSNSGSPQLRDTPADVNVVNLAFLQGHTLGMVGSGSQSEASFIADAKALRAKGVRIVASVGGAGGPMDISNRQGFVDGVMAYNAKVPLDGLDWDIEGESMDGADVVWISKELKRLRGEQFAITMAPNGSNINDYQVIANELHRQGALDFIGQQFYDAVVSKEAALGRVRQLVSGGLPQEKVGIGMMVGPDDKYWTVEECLEAVRFIKATYPNVRGGYLWEAGRAGTSDWSSRLASTLKG